MAKALLLVASALAAVAAGRGEGSAPGDAAALLQQQVTAHRDELSHDAELERRHKPVIFVSVHEAGEATACQLARSNNEIIMATTRADVCNVEPWDDSAIWFPEPETDCATRHMQWLASGFSWAQLQQPLVARDYCPDEFFYGTIIRHPVNLALHQMSLMSANTTEKDSMLNHLLDCVEERQKGHGAACASVEFYPAANNLWVHLDNYLVRTFGGVDVWTLPPGAVNATHRELALQRLKGLDMVLTFEQLGSNSTKEKLRKAFGWKDLTALDVELKNQVQASSFDAQVVARIQRLNEHDLILYKALTSQGDGL